MRSWNLLSCLYLRETLLRVIAVSSNIVQITVKLRSTLAATNTATEHVLTELSFDLCVRNKAFLLILNILFTYVTKEPVAIPAHYLLILMINKIGLRALLRHIIVLINRHNCVLLCLHPHLRVVFAGLLPRKWRLHRWTR